MAFALLSKDEAEGNLIVYGFVRAGKSFSWPQQGRKMRRLRSSSPGAIGEN